MLYLILAFLPFLQVILLGQGFSAIDVFVTILVNVVIGFNTLAFKTCFSVSQHYVLNSIIICMHDAFAHARNWPKG